MAQKNKTKKKPVASRRGRIEKFDLKGGKICLKESL